MDNNTNKTIKQLYENLTYFDSYGSSVIFLVILTIVLIIFYLYCSAMTNAQKIKQDWVNQRCKLTNLPFAGYINKPPDVTAFEYTKLNFDFCIQNNITNMTGNYLEPLTYVINTIKLTATMITTSINSSKLMIKKMYDLFSEIIQQIVKLLVNVLLPIQKIIIAFKDTFEKLAGIILTLVYSFIGAYYSIQSILTIVAKALFYTLIALAVIVVMLWLSPFTWVLAAEGTVIFTAVAIPLAIFLNFFVKIFNVDLGLKIPKGPAKPRVGKCFDPETSVKLKNGTIKAMKDLNLGDILENGSIVEAVMKIDNKRNIVPLYVIKGQGINNKDIYVTGSHLVLDNKTNKFCKVENYFKAKITDKHVDWFSCLITSDHKIQIGKEFFWDWEDQFVKEKLKL
jgi:hypothetical protein